jgi:hypothetical protein
MEEAPKPKARPITFQPEDDIRPRLDAFCKDTRRKISAAINQLLDEALQVHESKS